MSALKNITEMDYADQRLHGYYVRIQRDGKQYARMFSVSEHGSLEEALHEAIAFRDSILEQWKKLCGGKDETIQYQSTNTGFPGISLSEEYGHHVLQVNLRDENGKPVVKTLPLPSKDSKNYEKKFEQKFNTAKKMIDDYNRKRFGGRWYHYKKRKNIE